MLLKSKIYPVVMLAKPKSKVIVSNHLGLLLLRIDILPNVIVSQILQTTVKFKVFMSVIT